MSEKSPDSGAIKKRLLSLYESSSPQLFTQLLVDYDVAAQKLGTESTRIHDLRAAARLQILFADGFKPAAAIQFLQEAIRHIEAHGLPSSEGAVLYPDGSEPSRHLGVEYAPAEQRAEAEALPSPAHEPLALPSVPPPAAASQPQQQVSAVRENRVGRLPALFSALYHSQPLTALNLSVVAGGENQPVLDR
ncbi:MAG TPA: hypothetical protein VM864_04575 [Pyrinomonadaceae bacterium]|jgi:hypothetical protein|nr:hypothetical protein [Pyrinomonadaceae bacterium]